MLFNIKKLLVVVSTLRLRSQRTVSCSRSRSSCRRVWKGVQPAAPGSAVIDLAVSLSV